MEIEVLSWKELVALAGTVGKARGLLKLGAYRRVFRDAYVPCDVPDDAESRAAALRTVLPAGAVVSHWAALWVLGLPVLTRVNGLDVIDITVPRDHRLAPRRGIQPHTALVADEDLVEINGQLFVSAARAYVDVARSYGLVEGVACGDAALRAGATTIDRIQESLERARGLREVVRAREGVEHLEPRSESLMESRLRVGFVLAGGPRMRAQVDLYDEHSVHHGRADLFLDGVVVEYDGRDSRLEKVKFTGDRERRNDVSDLAVEVRHFTGGLYYNKTPRQRLEILLRALEIAKGRVRPRLRFGPDTLRAPKLRPLQTRAETDQARRTA